MDICRELVVDMMGLMTIIGDELFFEKIDGPSLSREGCRWRRNGMAHYLFTRSVQKSDKQRSILENVYVSLVACLHVVRSRT